MVTTFPGFIFCMFFQQRNRLAVGIKCKISKNLHVLNLINIQPAQLDDDFQVDSQPFSWVKLHGFQAFTNNLHRLLGVLLGKAGKMRMVDGEFSCYLWYSLVLNQLQPWLWSQPLGYEVLSPSGHDVSWVCNWHFQGRFFRKCDPSVGCKWQ